MNYSSFFNEMLFVVFVIVASIVVPSIGLYTEVPVYEITEAEAGIPYNSGLCMAFDEITDALITGAARRIRLQGNFSATGKVARVYRVKGTSVSTREQEHILLLIRVAHSTKDFYIQRQQDDFYPVLFETKPDPVTDGRLYP